MTQDIEQELFDRIKLPEKIQQLLKEVCNHPDFRDIYDNLEALNTIEDAPKEFLCKLFFTIGCFVYCDQKELKQRNEQTLQ